MAFGMNIHVNDMFMIKSITHTVKEPYLYGLDIYANI